MKILTKYDLCIIGFVLLASVMFYIFIGFTAAKESPRYVRIKVNGEPYAVYNLADTFATKTVEINTRYGKNILEISNNGAKMTYSDCPDKLDLKCGQITKLGQIIVCVPNRITVELSGDGAERVDKVTY